MLPPDDPRHGRLVGYGHWRCRCTRCAEVRRVYNRNRKDRLAVAPKDGLPTYDQVLTQARNRRWEHMSNEIMNRLLDACYRVPRVADMSDGQLYNLGLRREDGWI